MDTQLHILILEDNASDAELVQRELRKAGLDFAAQRDAGQRDLPSGPGRLCPRSHSRRLFPAGI